MPLPKEIKAALDAWKAGTGEYPGQLDDGVFFPTEGAFQAELGRKLKGRETQARDSATANFLSQLGLTDPSEIEAVKTTLEQSGVLKTETDKLRGQLTKAAKDLEDSKKEAETFKAANTKLVEQTKIIAKRDAIAKFFPRVVDTEVFADLVTRHLDVSDDGKVSIKGDDKKTLDVLIDETLKAKPYLKNPEFKEGTGTKPQPETTTNLPFAQADKDKPLTFAQQAINGLVAGGYKPPVTAGSGP